MWVILFHEFLSFTRVRRFTSFGSLLQRRIEHWRELGCVASNRTPRPPRTRCIGFARSLASTCVVRREAVSAFSLLERFEFLKERHLPACWTLNSCVDRLEWSFRRGGNEFRTDLLRCGYSLLGAVDLERNPQTP